MQFVCILKTSLQLKLGQWLPLVKDGFVGNNNLIATWNFFFFFWGRASLCSSSCKWNSLHRPGWLLTGWDLPDSAYEELGLKAPFKLLSRGSILLHTWSISASRCVLMGVEGDAAAHKRTRAVMEINSSVGSSVSVEVKTQDAFWVRILLAFFLLRIEGTVSE